MQKSLSLQKRQLVNIQSDGFVFPSCNRYKIISSCNIYCELAREPLVVVGLLRWKPPVSSSVRQSSLSQSVTKIQPGLPQEKVNNYSNTVYMLSRNLKKIANCIVAEAYKLVNSLHVRTFWQYTFWGNQIWGYYVNIIICHMSIESRYTVLAWLTAQRWLIDVIIRLPSPGK